MRYIVCWKPQVSTSIRVYKYSAPDIPCRLEAGQTVAVSGSSHTTLKTSVVWGMHPQPPSVSNVRLIGAPFEGWFLTIKVKAISLHTHPFILCPIYFYY
jgi:hypothetical protein